MTQDCFSPSVSLHSFMYLTFFLEVCLKPTDAYPGKKGKQDCSRVTASKSHIPLVKYNNLMVPHTHENP